MDTSTEHQSNGAAATPAIEPPIAAPQTSTALVRRSPLEEIRELVAYLNDLKIVCEQLCKATVLPKEMQNPANLQLVLMQGLSMGFTVPQAIRASFIIPPKKEGEVARVGYYVDSLVALVRQSPKCRFFRIEETTSKRHRLVCARTDEPESVVHAYELTREEAAASGMDKSRWRDRNTGEWREELKHQWIAMPADMLNARNCGRGVKRTFQDVVFGMNTPDEIEEIVIADRQEGEVFAAIPRAAMYAKRADVPADSTQSPPRAASVSSPPPSPQQSSTDAAPPATSDEPVDAELVPDEEAPSSGDPAWDQFLHEIAQLTNDRDMLEALPDDVTRAWDQRVGGAKTRRDLNGLAPWINAAAKRAGQSKACSEVAAHFTRTFNERNAKLREEERAAKANGGAS